MEDSISEDSSTVKVQPVKTPMPGQPQYFAPSVDVRTGKSREFVPKQMFKVAQPISEKTKPDEDTDSRLRAMEQALTQFLKSTLLSRKSKTIQRAAGCS